MFRLKKNASFKNLHPILGKISLPSNGEFAGTHLRGVFRAGNKGCWDMVLASALCSMPVRGCCSGLFPFFAGILNVCVCVYVCVSLFEKEKKRRRRRRMTHDGKVEGKEGKK